MNWFTIVFQDAEGDFDRRSTQARNYEEANKYFEKEIDMGGVFVVSIFESAILPKFHFEG